MADFSAIQTFLNTQGFKLAADGQNGPATKRALMAWQIAHNLRGDGMWGPNTEAAAKALGYGAAVTPAKPVNTGVLDDRSLETLSHVHPKLQEKVKTLIAFAAADGFTLRVTQGLRTFAEQDALYSQGRTRKGPVVTNARAGQSNHNYGLAVDVAFIVNGQISWDDHLYAHIGAWADKAGLAWGGKWHKPDLPHVEFKNLPPWSVLLGLYRNGGIANVWSKF